MSALCGSIPRTPLCQARDVRPALAVVLHRREAADGADDGLRLAPDQEGTIIGVSGAYTPHGEPTLSIALQFWPMSDESLPSAIASW